MQNKNTQGHQKVSLNSTVIDFQQIVRSSSMEGQRSVFIGTTSPFGLTRRQCREVRLCLSRFAKTSSVSYDVFAASNSRERRFNIVAYDGDLKVEFFYPHVTIVLKLSDVKERYARRICANRYVTILQMHIHKNGFLQNHKSLKQLLFSFANMFYVFSTRFPILSVCIHLYPFFILFHKIF